MLPSSVIIETERKRCDDIVCEEWWHVVEEYGRGPHVPIVQELINRITDRIRRIE